MFDGSNKCELRSSRPICRKITQTCGHGALCLSNDASCFHTLQIAPVPGRPRIVSPHKQHNMVNIWMLGGSLLCFHVVVVQCGDWPCSVTQRACRGASSVQTENTYQTREIFACIQLSDCLGVHMHSTPSCMRMCLQRRCGICSCPSLMPLTPSASLTCLLHHRRRGSDSQAACKLSALPLTIQADYAFHCWLRLVAPSLCRMLGPTMSTSLPHHLPLYK